MPRPPAKRALAALIATTLPQLLFASPLANANLASASATLESGALEANSIAHAARDISSQPDGMMSLYLQVWLNWHDHGLLPARWQDERVWMHAQVLRSIGVQTTTEGWQAVDELPGADVQLDFPRQQLRIQLPLSQLNLPTTRLEMSAEKTLAAAPVTTGLLLNYDAHASVQNGHQQLSANSQWRLFGRFGVLEHSHLHHFGGHGQRRSTRLDTWWLFSDPQRMLSLRVGDVITPAQPGLRNLRMGGVQLRRDFSLQPYRLTRPIPLLAGEAVLPSQVELFVRGVRQFASEVPAGPFQLQAPPGLGNGMAQLAITDALGRSTRVEVALNDNPQLLAPGLSDGALTLGYLRKHYGQESFAYERDLAVQGHWRRGVNERLTLGLHAEGSRDIAVAGMNASVSTGLAHQWSAGISHAQHAAGHGQQWHGSWRWYHRDTPWSLYAHAMGTQGDYRDVAAWQQSGLPLQRSINAGIGYSSPTLGGWQLSALHVRQAGQEDTRLLSFGWSKQLARNFSVQLYAQHDLDNQRLGHATLHFNWQLSEHNPTHAYASVRAYRQRQMLEAGVQRPAPYSGGLGWQLLARSEDDHGSSGQAQLNGRHRYGQWEAGLNHRTGQTYGWMSASGALVMLGGGVFATRHLHDAFAVVSTGGIANVPVLLENRLYGKTDRNGRLLLSDLRGWDNNHVSIDPMRLPANLRLTTPQQVAVPRAGSGMLLSFDMQTTRAALLVLHDEQGQALPVATPVQLLGQKQTSPLFVGHDGLLYLEHFATDSQWLQVVLPDGQVCRVQAHWPQAPESQVPRIGPLICRVETLP